MTAAARPPSILPLLLLAAISTAAASDSLSPGQPLTTNQSLISAVGGRFRLGFFSPDGTNRRLYLAIWYNLSLRTAVWVANRDHPLLNSTGLLTLTANGTLTVTDGAGTVYWSSSGASNSTGPATARLKENGNLVVQDGSGRVIWQSFDHPSDSFLPDMKLGSDYRTGIRRVFTSWLSSDDPATGDYSIMLDLHGVPQTLLLSSSSTVRWRSGPWTGQRFSGIPAMASYASYPLSFEYISGENGTFYSFHSTSSSFISYVRVTPDGFLQRLLWVEGTSSWNQIWYVPGDPCDYVSTCGPFGLCDASQALSCSCLQGFSPRSPEEWQLRDWKDGCARNTPLDCRNGTDGFAAMEGVKLPDTSNATVDYGMSLDECRRTCLEDCRCAAYAAANISDGVLAGCIQWTGNLTDIRVYSANSRQDLFLRLAAKDLASSSSSKSKRVWLPILVCALVAAILAGWGGYLFWRKKRRVEDTVHESGDINQNYSADYRDYSVGREMELPLFDFSTIALSTNHFSENNKLGEGGFGLVYKGKLEDRQDVAIKRLGRNSLQGTDEFMNEVKLIAKLQHRNLVRLLGCCIDGEERMLIYEYMANGSLDTFLFDKTSDCLDWDTRYKIIIGIARGLLYLHQDSRFRIIHRDLKASNILLDGDMNPKISDFGMARIFGGDEAAGVNTRRIVGTYGYMSPEYAMDGVFSVKSDVFSFGVLVLEIISGRRNRGTYSTDPQSNLLGLTWSLWNQGKSIEIADKSIFSSYLISMDVLKCINIGLLCVQARPEDRPTMSSVAFMLGSESASSLPQPKQPGFVVSRVSAETSSSSTFHKMQESWTVNEITVTKIFEGR